VAIPSQSRIVRVELGTVADSGFVVATAFTPTVVFSDPQYQLTFSASARFKDTTSRSETIRIRLVDEYGSSVHCDTSVATYKYPYPSTEIVLTADNIPTVPYFQDVVFLGDTLFFRPTADGGLHRLDPISSTVRQLFPYPGGDHLAADSGYVFIDGHSRIHRWNTATSTMTYNVVVYGNPSTDNVAGMDVLDGSLLVIGSSSAIDRFRCRYDYRGALIDSIPFTTSGYYLAVRNAILHRISDRPIPKILRYSFNGIPLASLYPPARQLMGIKFHGSHLYFCDSNRRSIGRVAIADLREMP
jgi:hypothetical protein